MNVAKTNLFMNAVTTNLLDDDYSHGKLICSGTKARKIGMYGKFVSSGHRTFVKSRRNPTKCTGMVNTSFLVNAETVNFFIQPR